MRNCFIVAGVAFLGLGAAGISAAAEPALKATSVVRADSSSGRLVRRLIVPAVRTRAADGATRSLADIFRQRARVDDLVEEAARKHNVDPLLVHSVIQVESNYNPFAVSPKGAEGLMQLIPSTARRFGVKNAFDPSENIDAGVRYLKYLQGLFEDDRLALAAYNAGEGAVARYNWIPPYPETLDYVDRVGEKYGELKRDARQKAGMALPEGAEEPRYRPLEAFIDTDGRLHLRTR